MVETLNNLFNALQANDGPNEKRAIIHFLENKNAHLSP